MRALSVKMKRGIFEAAKACVTWLGKRFPAFRTFARSANAKALRARYEEEVAKTQVDPRVIVFESYAGRSYSCSPKAIYQEMLRNPEFADFEFIWVFRLEVAELLRSSVEGIKTEGVRELYGHPLAGVSLNDMFSQSDIDELKRATIVSYQSAAYTSARARSKYWISNSIIPTYLIPSQAQRYIQTWHGTPFKRIGCDLVDGTDNAMFSPTDVTTRYTAEGSRISMMPSPSPYYSEIVKRAFALSRLGKTEVVVETGYPRNDFLVTVTAAQIESTKVRLGIPIDKKVILYAPTWRDNQHKTGFGYTYDTQVDFFAWQNRLGDEFVVLFRAHYLVASAFDFSAFKGFLFDVSAIADINDLYVVSDILITDYSSVFFDFAILRRPILFFMYDLEEYTNTIRGLYLDLDELPGPVISDGDELLDLLATDGRPLRLLPPNDEFIHRFLPFEDGHSAQRVLSHVIEEAPLR